MKGFFRYLPPFSPDYSGAVSALYNAGGMVVLCDPGGCSGNVAGYDEPRFYGKREGFFSAAIREMDTIFGRDDKLEKKIISAAAMDEYEFIALVGTPAVSVIGTDLEAVAKTVEKKTGIPAFSVETTGMEDYSVGEMKAITAFTKKFLPENQDESEHSIKTVYYSEQAFETAYNSEQPIEKTCNIEQHFGILKKVGIFGATPLNLAGNDSYSILMGRLFKELNPGEMPVFLSEKGAVEKISNIKRLKRIICLSPGGIKACRIIKDRFGIDYEVMYPKTDVLMKVADEVKDEKNILIIHQQAVGNTLRNLIRIKTDAHISVGSFFYISDEISEPQDMKFSREDELAEAAKSADLIISDPMYWKVFKNKPHISLPHRALSGDLYI